MMNILAYVIPQCFTVPEGDGRGTIESSNGVSAARLLSQVERRMINQEPFSWVLIRPPWTSTGLCCKACVCEHMKLHHHEEVNVYMNINILFDDSIVIETIFINSLLYRQGVEFCRGGCVHIWV